MLKRNMLLYEIKQKEIIFNSWKGAEDNVLCESIWHDHTAYICKASVFIEA